MRSETLLGKDGAKLGLMNQADVLGSIPHGDRHVKNSRLKFGDPAIPRNLDLGYVELRRQAMALAPLSASRASQCNQHQMG